MKRFAALIVLLAGLVAYAGIQTGPVVSGGGGGGPGSFSSISLTVGIIGVDGSGSAGAGIVGEYRETAIAYASKVTVAGDGAGHDVATLALTAGDWDVQGNINMEGAGVTATALYGMIATNTINNPATGLEVGGIITSNTTVTTGITIPRRRFLVTNNFTIHMCLQSAATTGTLNAWGDVTARRVR